MLIQKIKKKPLMMIVILAIVIAMCLAGVINAFAEGAAQVTVGSTTEAVEPGDDVVLPVSIANNPGIACYNFEVSFDHTALTLTEISNTDSLSTSGTFIGNIDPTKVGDGKGIAGWYQTPGMITENGTLFYLHFTVKDTAATDDYDIGIALVDNQPAQVANEDGDIVPVTFTPGVLQVVAPVPDTTIDLADFTDGVYTISEGGEYTVATDAAGTIQISTTEEVKLTGGGISGTANAGLSINYTVAGADLTIDDLYIPSPVSGNNIINFMGTGNELTLAGASLLETTEMHYAGIHVPSDGDLTIDGSGTLYSYKSGLGANIGGDCDPETTVGETNGTITFNGGTIFAKGSMTGSIIGAGQKGLGGTVIINDGCINLMTKARGAVIGGGGENSGVYGAGGTVYINGGTVLLYTDWTGSQIGCGGGNVVYSDGGTVYIKGGSLKTIITSNAGAKWGTSSTLNTISDKAITATKLNNDTDEDPVYLLNFDTTQLSGSPDTFTVKVDGVDFYTGSLHQWTAGNPASNVNLGAFVADTTDTNLYLYLSDTNHKLTVNGQDFNYSWDDSTKTFNLVELDYWDGTADTSWYDSENPLTAYTITTPEQLAGLASLVNTGNDFAGVTINLGNDIYLNSDSTSHNWTPIGTAAITAGGNRQAVIGSNAPFDGTFDGNGYTINNLYISSTDNVQALFGSLTGTVEDLTVNGSVTSTVEFTAEYVNLCVGGIVAFNYGGTITDVVNDVIVDGSTAIYWVGGVAAYNLEGNILRSVNNASVTGYQGVGGIVGENGGTIEYCYNAGKVDATNSMSKNGVGGIAGKNGQNNTPVETGVINSCYNKGEVGRSGQKWIGGIAGFQNGLSSTTNCYNIGNIIVGAGRYAAIVGQEEGTSNNNYSLDSQANDTNQTVIGTKLSAADLKAAASLLGGAFVSDTQNLNNGYPVLFWQNGSNMYDITIDANIINGTVTAISAAVPGTVVVVDVTPIGDYQLKSLKYTTDDVNYTNITETEGVYSFVMPASAVTITAEFIAHPTVWDGTADTSWYNTTDTEFHLTTPEQLAGLATISNGIGVVNGTTTAIDPDNFEGKTIYLDNDIWLNKDT
jgi:hypothetical protein